MYHFDAADNLFKSILLNSYQSKFTVLALDKLSEIAIIKDSLDKSEEYLNNIITNKKTFPLIRNKAVYKKAKISFWKGDFERALNYLNSVTKNLSDDMANDAIELSIIINTLKTDSLSLIKYANADFLTERRSFEDAALEFRDLAESSSLILVKELANFKFAEIMISLDKYPLAMEILENISDKELSSVYADKSLFLLANCYQFGIGNLEKAKQAYEKLLANFPNSLYLDKARERLSAIKLNESTSI
jgi:tetratricopeptide (TPR) repeat protein